MKSGSETLKKFNIQLVINLITVTGVFAFMLYLTARCPYITDDWHFKFVWKDFDLTGSDTRVSNLGDIFTSIKNYYLNSGGRALCHFLVYIVVNINKNVFNVLNAVMFVLLGILIYRIATKLSTPPPKHNCLLLLIYAAIMLFIPMFGDVCLWLSGSVNYLWPSVLLLACFLLIDKCFDRLTLKKALLMSIPIAISAATNETTGGMLIVFMVLTFIVKKKKFTPLYLIPVIAALPGMLLVILAPGNAARAGVDDLSELMITNLIVMALEYFDYLSKNVFYMNMMIFWVALVKLKDTFKHEKNMKCSYAVKNLLNILAEFRYAITGFAGVMALSLSVPAHRPLIFGYVCFIAEGFSCLIYIMNRIGKRSTRYKIRPHELFYFALILLMPGYIRHLGYAPAILLMAITEAAILAVEKYYAKNRKPSEKPPVKFPMSLAACVAAAVVCMAVIAIDTVNYNDSADKMNYYYAQMKEAVIKDDAQAVVLIKLELYDVTNPFVSDEFRRCDENYTREWYSLYIAEESSDENLQVIQYFLSPTQQNAENPLKLLT